MVWSGTRKVYDTFSNKTHTTARVIFLKHRCYHALLFFRRLYCLKWWFLHYSCQRLCLKKGGGPGEFWSSTPASLGNKMMAANNSFDILGMKNMSKYLNNSFTYWILNGRTEIWRKKQELTRKEGGKIIEGRQSSSCKVPVLGRNMASCTAWRKANRSEIREI